MQLDGFNLFVLSSAAVKQLLLYISLESLGQNELILLFCYHRSNFHRGVFGYYVEFIRHKNIQNIQQNGPAWR